MSTVERKKYKQLTVTQRMHIAEKLLNGVLPKHLAREFGVCLRTVYQIQKSAVQLRQQAEMQHPPTANRKKLREPVLSELDSKLYLWFIEQSTNGNILTDKILQNKATELNKNCGGSSNYVCSRGWIWRFKKRHDISLLQMAGESREADYEAAENVTSTFSKYLEVKKEEKVEVEEEEEEEEKVEEEVMVKEEEKEEEAEVEMNIEPKKEEEEEEEEGGPSTHLQFKEHEVANAINVIVAWSKQYDISIQKHAKALKDHFQEHGE